TLSLTFNLPLRHEEIEQFRRGICAVAGSDNDLFHNEKLDSEAGDSHKYIERYPLIQYQVHEGRASILGINQGADALAQLEKNNLSGEFRMPGNKNIISLKVTDRRQDSGFAMKMLAKNKTCVYRIYGYVPLNPENYAMYK